MIKRFVAIEGLIGSGKTTLCKELAKRTAFFGEGCIVQLEPAEGKNPYLAKYYADPSRYAFQMQTFLLSKRNRMHRAAQSLALNDYCSVIADRTYWGDRCFAEVQLSDGYFTEDDFETYLSLHKDMQEGLLYPSCIIHVNAPVDLTMKRIARRQTEIEGRKCECGIKREYLQKLDDSIRRMMHSISSHVPTYSINALDNNGNERNVAELADECIEFISSIKRNPLDAWQGVI